jgi:hypothetical protein
MPPNRCEYTPTTGCVDAVASCRVRSVQTRPSKLSTHTCIVVIRSHLATSGTCNCVIRTHRILLHFVVDISPCRRTLDHCDRRPSSDSSSNSDLNCSRIIVAASRPSFASRDVVSRWRKSRAVGDVVRERAAVDTQTDADV